MTTRSWLDVPDGSDFPVQNLPYGVFSTVDGERRVGVAIGDRVLDVSRVDVPSRADFGSASLNAFLGRGRPLWDAVRARLIELLTDESHRSDVEPHLVPADVVTLHLPFEVADYVDFYSSEHHASNVGRIFRPNADPITPNWRHLPIGYHGRAGTVVVSGTPIVRPHGQRRGEPDPTYGPERKLDIEAEVGFVVGTPSVPGTPVPTADFAEHVFGVVLLNDWSAREIQSWESVPLGPFLGKSFATSISPWVVPLAALEAARVVGPVPDPTPLPYLRCDEPWGLDIDLMIDWNGTVVSRPPFASMYWNAAQQLAHMTVNGASLRTGDLFASGTVSGPAPDQRGSLLELSWNGTESITLHDGSIRTFLADGDTITIRGSAPAGPSGEGAARIGFGALTGTIISG